MNETTTTKKTEFVFRRLADSFDQFTGDLWGAVPLWLLAVVVVLVAARVVYRYANPASRAPGAKDPGAKALSAGMWGAAVGLTIWVLVAYYVRDTEQTRRTPEAVSVLGSGNVAKWYSFTIGLFVLGCAFVALMYVKDTKTVRWFWAVPLALLRVTVYAILCLVFLLPAVQTWEDTNKQSRAVSLVSPISTRSAGSRRPIGQNHWHHWRSVSDTGSPSRSSPVEALTRTSRSSPCSSSSAIGHGTTSSHSPAKTRVSVRPSSSSGSCSAPGD